MQALDGRVDAVLILSEKNRRYFTGFASSAGILLVTEKQAYFLTDFRYVEKAKRDAQDCEVISLTNSTEQLRALFADLHIRTCGVEKRQITLHEFMDLQAKFPDIEFDVAADVNNIIDAMRAVKSHREMKRIRQAQAITDAAFTEILTFLRPGVTEREVAAELEYRMRRMGADGLAFETIAVSGQNSSMPHGTPTDKPLAHGDFLTIDFGAQIDGYASDMTRTVMLGTPSDEQRRVYDTVLHAQCLALEAIRPGAVCKEIDKIARDYIDAQGYEGCFGHGLGHSVGLDIHELPAFNLRDTTQLQPGMVITVEPGVYLSGQFGVRIEDMVVITEDGCENLTQSVKEMICLSA